MQVIVLSIRLILLSYSSEFQLIIIKKQQCRNVKTSKAIAMLKAFKAAPQLTDLKHALPDE